MNRRRCGLVLLNVWLLVAAVPAYAFPGGFGGGGFQVQQHQQRPQRDRQSQQPPRRQDAQPNNPQGPQNPQRMSPDERRQLRRDLRDAGRDVYPQRRDWQR